MQEPLPDIATSSQAQVGRYAKVGPNPLDDLDDIPIGSKAQPASITNPQSIQKKEAVAAPTGDGQESLEERKLRLKARSEALKKKKREEEEAKNRPIEEQKRDDGDIFRNTAMKFNESPD